ncbi:MAG: NADH oxidase [Deltaproteobacteria bacterium]|nr:MAG: NADH oxidase [Deltaproteobacteria bacterium]
MGKKTAFAALAAPLTLPNGTVIKNRFFKSAMSEALGTRDFAPKPGLFTLYRRWAEGGSGIVMTGNVMIDSRALGEPGNVVIEDERHMDALSAWAAAGTIHDTQLWVQLNHPGKQSPKALSPEPVAPSAIPFSNRLSRFFNPPRALTETEIKEIIERFARSAGIVKAAGFSGVQIHGAHGYLVSQFLSPRHNQRSDQWGGSAENRMRFVREIYRAIRQEVGADFPVGIKLNSTDFLRDGFAHEDSVAVIQALADDGIDLVEISGGTYEAPAMTGVSRRQPAVSGTEAYFLDFARQIRDTVHVPLVVTGGFRSAAAMQAALDSSGIDMVGLGRPLCLDTDAPNRILSGEAYQSSVKPLKTGFPLIDKTALLEITWYEKQLKRMADGGDPDPKESALLFFFKSVFASGKQIFMKRRA